MITSQGGPFAHRLKDGAMIPVPRYAAPFEAFWRNFLLEIGFMAMIWM
jgi:hypothetical protein